MEKKIIISNTESPAAAAIETLIKTIANEQNQISLPVRLTDVAKKLGIDVQQLPLDSDVDGMLVKEKPNVNFKAVSNMFKSDHRKRFTLAHEIGHYVKKYQDWPPEKEAGIAEWRDSRSAAGFDPDEIWANQFAAALLMPASIVRKYWAQGKTDEQMAKIFDVSTQAMNLRRVNLGLN